MKKTILLSILVLSFVLSKAQTKTNTVNTSSIWQNAILRSDGRTELDNVEAYCMKITCNGEEFVLIKFVNKNDRKVRIEWIDAIYVNGVWFYSKNPNPKIFYLEPNSTTVGQCDGQEKLKVQISSIIDNPKDFAHYTVSGLTISK